MFSNFSLLIAICCLGHVHHCPLHSFRVKLCFYRVILLAFASISGDDGCVYSQVDTSTMPPNDVQPVYGFKSFKKRYEMSNISAHLNYDFHVKHYFQLYQNSF